MLNHHATIVLVGNPNSGKTTLFNTLTGSCQSIGNWAGVTVEQISGKFCVQGENFQIIDLPGIYSLTPISSGSQDENVTSEYLRTSFFSWVLNVVDVLHLERHLYLTIQCLEQQLPLIVALNRMDELDESEKKNCTSILSEALPCSVVPISAREGRGVEILHPLFLEPNPKKPWSVDYPPIIEKALTQLPFTRYQGLCYLEGEAPPPDCANQIEKIKQTIEQETGTSADVLIATTRYRFIEDIVKKIKYSQTHFSTQENKLTQIIDQAVCHRYLGIPIFLGMMYSLFFFAIKVGGFFQEYVEWAAHRIFVEQMGKIFHYFHLPGWVNAIVVSGAGEGLTTVLTFIPVIGAMFLALAFLEDCGYMARAAFVVDRLMRAIGLPGKSFVPMIVGFGCNVPAIMGMRTLENKGDRILAVMMSPFMSCGARLAIFTVFVSAFFPQGGQNIVFLLYAIGIFTAVLTGWLLKKTLLKGEIAPLLLEMPEYQWPNGKILGLHAWYRLKRFLFNASKLIILVCMLMGGLNSINFEGKWLEATEQRSSILAAAGKTMAPVFKPMGIEEENWPAAVGLLTGILAKEVVVGTLNSLYSNGESSDRPVYGEMVKCFGGQISAFAYLLFVLLYFPCVSATAAMLREVKKGWTIFAVCWTTGLAYGVAVGYYQTATFFEHPLQSSVWVGGLCILAVATFLGIRHYGQTTPSRIFPTPIVLKN